MVCTIVDCFANGVHVLFLVEEGFFCQTTTSEERDFTRAVAGETDVLDEDGEIDTSVDHYYSMSSQESEEDTFRYATVAFVAGILLSLCQHCSVYYHLSSYTKCSHHTLSNLASEFSRREESVMLFCGNLN